MDATNDQPGFDQGFSMSSGTGASPSTEEGTVLVSPQWEDLDWNHLSLDHLIAVQRKVRDVILMKRKAAGKSKRGTDAPGDVWELPEPIRFGKQPYSATVGAVAPAHLRHQLSDGGERCILGVSLGGGNFGNFEGSKLEAIVRWIAPRFKRCCVLVGDNLGRLTLEARRDLPPAAAAAEARAIGRRYVATNASLFQHYTTERSSFEIRYGTEVAADPRFDEYLEQARRLYREDATFQGLVHGFAQLFVSRLSAAPGVDDGFRHEDKTALSRDYMLEEVALFACLAEDGWDTLVYPGTLIKSFVEIAEGLHPGVPAPLQRFRYILLDVSSTRPQGTTSVPALG